jgi:hypothetical protein
MWLSLKLAGVLSIFSRGRAKQGGEVAERAFVIMQVGAKDSPERKRADEIYGFIVAPAVADAGLEPYRADLDLSPGAITPKMLSELLGARVVIADLTGRNPNVFYELGITHSFSRPLISIADSSSSLPFDAKDERVIELGEYPAGGLTYVQGEQAKASLQESLRLVLAADYVPPSPLREVAANRSVDQLAPDDPLAAEMAQIRETLEEIHKRVMSPRYTIPRSVRADVKALREVVGRNMEVLDDDDLNLLSGGETSSEQDAWTEDLRKELGSLRRAKAAADDPWATDAGGDGFSDEPPF